MEISKLTICRQDVIVVSDTESPSNELDSNRKKKSKRKIECVRNVKLTKITVNRTVPNCYRQGCRNAQYDHRQTSKNIKYRKREESPVDMKYEEKKTSAKNKHCEMDKNGNVSLAMTRKVYSPITVSSDSKVYDSISSCSFNVLSSDSDELEDLIKLTRKRMKNENCNSNPVAKSCATSTQYDYQNISSNEEVLDTSIHSLDTVVLCSSDTIPPPLKSDHRNQVDERNNNNIESSLCPSPKLDGNGRFQKKIPILSSQGNKGNLSPLYEISGKVFMEHYLNTSYI